ncbi:MAG: MFS transporter [Thermoleophilia bacterium]|nr:MFS transporter [Thermoleophilia bacterium]
MRERALRTLFPAGVDRRGIAVLSAGHLAADLFQGSVPALLPFLIRDRGYSYAAAGALFLMASLGSSLLQPVLGIFADRVRAGWLMPAGLLVAGIGLAGSGLVESHAGTAALFLAGGFGVAAFHPEGVRFASQVSAARRGAGMSVFAVGGNLGFALGPILVTPVVLTLGLGGTPVVGGLIVASGLVVLGSLRYLERFRPAPGTVAALPGQAERNEWRPFGLAAGAATSRAVVAGGLQAFVPLYAIAELASTEATGNAAVAVMLVAGAVGTLVGGRLADCYGFRPVVVWSLALGVPLALALPFVGVTGMFLVLAVFGFAEGMNFYPLVVIAQNALPGYLGLAAGVVLGLAIGVAAGTVALLGVLADAAGLTAVLWVLVGATALGWLLAAALPPERRGSTAGPQAAVASVAEE